MGIRLIIPKLHVEQNVKPHSLKGILQVFEDQESKSTSEIHSIVSRNLWPTLREIQQRNYLLKNLKVMKHLGIIIDSRDGNELSYHLSERGIKLKRTSLFRNTQFLDFIHFLMYITFEWNQDANCAFSWTYQKICDLLWDDRPTDISGKIRSLIDRVLIASKERFDLAEEISLSKYTIDGVNNWIGNLVPPFIENRKNRRYSTNGRNFCSPEILTLSIETTYRRRGLSFGSPLLLNEETTEDICRTALLSVQAFEQVLDIVLANNPQILMHSGLWGRSLILDKSYIDKYIGV